MERGFLAWLRGVCAVLDVLSNDIFIAALQGTGVCSVLVSEEDPDIIKCEGDGESHVQECTGTAGASCK